MVAVEIAHRDASKDEEVFVLSLDDMGWTRAWLSEGKRADYLAAYFRADGSVLFRIIESKSESSGEQVPCDPEGRPRKWKLVERRLWRLRVSLRRLRV